MEQVSRKFFPIAKARSSMEIEQKKIIGSVRDTIDSIDNRILALLKERLACAKEIGRLKDGEKKSQMGPSPGATDLR